MTVPSFATLSPSYDRLWAELVPTPSHVPALTKICQGLLTHKATYQGVAQTVWNDPDLWWYVAITDQMEGGGGACTYLGNGQSLNRVTTEVPAGRGPFANFHDGAVDALTGSGGTSKPVPAPTSIAHAAYLWEGYNGWGYLNKPINDPYLASQSNEYTSGKYVADHVYDANAVSAQPGALTILKVLVGLDPTLFAQAPAIAAPIPLQPQQAPLPSTTEEIPSMTATAAAPVPQIDFAAQFAALQANINALQKQLTVFVPGAPSPAAVAASAGAAAAPAFVLPPLPPQIDLASMLAHLDVLMPIATIVMSAIPGAAPFAPLLMVAQKALHAVADVTTAMQSNPAALPGALGTHLAGIAPLLDQLKTVFPQLPWLSTIETVVGNAAKALPGPVTAKGTSP
jgi:lysozyme family protein